MRLKPNQVKLICQKILSDLRLKKLITVKTSEIEILTKMEEIFVADLRVEDDINRDANKLLDQYAHQAGGTIDREKMFQMIKKQLVKDRKVVI